MADTTDSTDVHLFDCAACQNLDRADGKEDGQFYSPEHLKTRRENKVVRSLEKSQDRAADAVTNFAGSLKFVYLHGVWFAIWIALNVGIFGAALKFDAFPFGLLTMIVSLEAIFLSTFVMVSQNRQESRSEVRAAIDFENNVRSLVWAVHIGAKLDVDPVHVEDIVQKAIRAARGDDPVH